MSYLSPPFKPSSREPDLVIRYWEFYWDEMVQYNALMGITFRIRSIEEERRMEYLDAVEQEWVPYQTDAREIYEAYISHLLEKAVGMGID